jgi:hypothetical protein
MNIVDVLRQAFDGKPYVPVFVSLG